VRTRAPVAQDPPPKEGLPHKLKGRGHAPENSPAAGGGRRPGQHHGYGQPRLYRRLAKFAELDPVALAVTGGDRLPPAPVHLLPSEPARHLVVAIAKIAL
jgi:hypothetical protein